MNLEDEIRSLEQRYSQAPDSRAFLPLADALKRAGELEKAADLCRRGLEKFPDFSSARVLLGECLAGLGNYEEAERNLEELSGTDPHNPRLLKDLAELAEQRGDTGRAKSLAEAVRRLERGDYDSGADAEDDEAEGTFEEPPVQSAGAGRQAAPREGASAQPEAELEVGDSDPGEIFLTRTLADLYRHQGHNRKAEKIYRALLEHGCDDPELRENLEQVAGGQESGAAGQETSGQAAAEASGAAEKAAAEVAEENRRAGSAQRQAPPETALGMGDEDFVERINAIFNFLLGESSAGGGETGSTAAEARESAGGEAASEVEPAPEDPDRFVDMLGNWIAGLKGARGS